MKNKNIILLYFLLLGSTQSAISQISRFNSSVGKSIVESQIISQSPNVAEMSRCVDRPVTYFNGTVGITIPLCDVSAKDINLPISLSYSSTGFKPSQEATWVGLGWTLSLNSCISRCIKCADDFLEYRLIRKGYASMHSGYYGSAAYSENQLTERARAFACPIPTHSGFCADNVDVDELVVDVEPDMFSYSMWNGGDKFVITNDPNSSEQATFTDKAAGYKLRIYSYLDPQAGNGNIPLHYFELVGRDGTVYEFKKRELTYTYSYGNEASSNCNVILTGYDTTSHDLYASSWFLTKITTPEKHIIYFDYEDEDFDAISQESCLRYREVVNNITGGSPEFMRGFKDESGYKVTERPAVYSWSKSKIKTARLKEIRWDTGKIIFTASARDDMYNYAANEHTPKKLDRIDVYNSADSLVHSFKFTYGYFGKNPTGYAYNDCLYKRLKLMSVEDVLTNGYKYSFEYQDENGDFPSKQTKSLDYWGYYNGKDYGRLYYCQAFDGNEIYEGAVKNSNEAMSMIGMLTAITYPTGGKETFSYEANHFMWPTYKQVGGQKLGTISQIESNKYHSSNELTRTFNTSTRIRLAVKGMYHRAFAKDSSCPYNTATYVLSITNKTTGKSQNIGASNTVSSLNWGTTDSDSIKSSIMLDAGSYEIKAFLPNNSWTVTWYFETYDPNPVTFQTEYNETLGAGLRIEQIAGNGKTRKFTYQNVAELLVDPVFYQVKTFSWLDPVIVPVDLENPPIDYKIIYSDMPQLSDDETIQCYDSRRTNCLIQFSESSVPLSTLAKGYDLGYGSVIEEISDGHRAVITEYQYEDIRKEYRQSPNPYQGTKPVFSNGLLKSKTIYDKNLASNDSTEVYREFIVNQSTQSKKIPAHDFSYTFGFFPHEAYWFNWYYPGYKTITADGLTSGEYYTYNADLLPVSIRQTFSGSASSDGTELVTDITYNTSSSAPTDIKMANANIVVPVKEITRTNGKIVSGKTISYNEVPISGRSQQSGTMFLPGIIYDVRRDASNANDESSLHQRVSYDRYDGYGNPLQVTRDGIPSVYIWGYSYEYPVAEISNITYQDLLNLNYVTSADLINIACSKTLTDSQMQKLIGLKNKIATSHLCSSMTIYTYKPLVGMTSQISPNGLTTGYEYDASGRLIRTYVKSADGKEHSLSKFQYNYVGGTK